MNFNIDKCSVMHCGIRNKNNAYYLYGKELRITESEKDGYIYRQGYEIFNTDSNTNKEG